MPEVEKWLLAAAALVVAAPAAVWLGRWLGLKAARAAPGMAMALWFLNAFLRLDPPPPPNAERVHRNDDDAGAPPTAGADDQLSP